MCLAYSAKTLAQIDILETVYLETDQGLNSRVNSFVTRDNRGYFYFFSRNSIQRYDGRNFENVSIAKLIDGKINLFDLKKIHTATDKIILEFPQEEFYTITAGGLELSHLPSYTNPSPRRIDNTKIPKETLRISHDKKTYTWGYDKVIIEDPTGSQKIVDLPYQIAPKFLRIDGKGNIIAAYLSLIHI